MLKAIPFRWVSLATAAFCMAVCYLPSMGIWFRTDDFAWLGLRDHWKFWPAMFTPLAQGTVRFLSERLLFWTFPAVFGIEPLPFRLLGFLTQVGASWMLALLTLHLTGSRLSSLMTIPIWLLSTGIAVSVCWISAYNQLLAGFLLIASVLAFAHRLSVLSWSAFLLGFGALESNAVLPLLLLAYAWFHARDRWRETIPYFAASAVYTVVWFFWIRRPSPEYQMTFDAHLPGTLWQYLVLLFGLEVRPWLPVLLLIPFAIWWRRTCFGMLWFLLALLPYLPLKDHVSDYYLALPAIGIAIAVASLPRYPAIALALLLAAFGWQTRTRAIGFYLTVTVPMERIVAGVVEVHEKNPQATIVLDNIAQLYIAQGLNKKPWELYGVTKVHLAKDLPRARLRAMLERGDTLVYFLQNGQLQNVTAAYGAVIRSESSY